MVIPGQPSVLRRKVLPYGRSRRVIAIIVIVSYFASIIFYVRTLPDEADATFVEPPANGVVVYVIMNEAKFATDRLTADVMIDFGEDLLDRSGPAPVADRDVTVTLEPVMGQAEFTIQRGTPMRVSASTTLFMQGAPYTYPFDAYRASFFAAAQERGEDGALTNLPTIAQMLVPEGFVGWRIQTLYPSTVEAIGGLYEGRAGPAEIQNAPSTLDGANLATLELRRAWSTVAISILILFLMVLLTTLSLLTSRAVQIGKKELNIGMAGWLAALLFAMPALRNLLPGSPPIGSWIDILVFFWVQIAVMISLASFVLYWLRKGPPPPAEEEAASEVAGESAAPS
jgi:hypothetical protein